MKNRETNILKQSTDTLSMGCYLGWHVVVLSVLRTETKKLVEYDAIRKCPLRTCAG